MPDSPPANSSITDTIAISDTQTPNVSERVAQKTISTSFSTAAQLCADNIQATGWARVHLEPGDSTRYTFVVTVGWLVILENLGPRGRAVVAQDWYPGCGPDVIEQTVGELSGHLWTREVVRRFLIALSETLAPSNG